MYLLQLSAKTCNYLQIQNDGLGYFAKSEMTEYFAWFEKRLHCAHQFSWQHQENCMCPVGLSSNYPINVEIAHMTILH